MAEVATADTGGHAALTAVDVHKSFGTLEVLKGVSLTAHSGDVIAMLGSSGSGKSTFLRCINLLETPNSGEVRVGGELIVADPRPRSLEFSRVLQVGDADRVERVVDGKALP